MINVTNSDQSNKASFNQSGDILYYEQFQNYTFYYSENCFFIEYTRKNLFVWLFENFDNSFSILEILKNYYLTYFSKFLWTFLKSYHNCCS